VAVLLNANAEDQDIRLEKPQLSLESTYVTLASAASIKLINRSDLVANFRWLLFSSEEDEREFRQRHRADIESDRLVELKQIEQDPNADAAAKTLINHKYKHILETIDSHPLLFSDDVFKLEPVEGIVWPHSSTTINVVFRPTVVGLHKKTIYCEVIGRETRLPLQLRVSFFHLTCPIFKQKC
jgi:hydrocephalus-inducing protein